MGNIPYLSDLRERKLEQLRQTETIDQLLDKSFKHCPTETFKIVMYHRHFTALQQEQLCKVSLTGLPEAIKQESTFYDTINNIMHNKLLRATNNNCSNVTDIYLHIDKLCVARYGVMRKVRLCELAEDES